MGEDELAELVRSNIQYFDRLVDFIHPRFYIPADDTTDKPWTFAMSKKQKEAARQKTKEKLKKARRDRLDPEKISTTSQLLQQQSAEAEHESDAEADEAGGDTLQGSADRVKSSLELRARLHKRIETIRAQRLVNKARDWQKRTKSESKKRKKSEESSLRANKRQKQQQQPQPQQQKQQQKDEHKTNEPVVDLEFGRVRIDAQKRVGVKKSKEKLLDQATKLQKDLQDPAKGAELGSKHSWDAAASRASGEKVFDNPKLLKQSLKRDQQRRDKSAQKWQDRHDSEAQRGEEKQQTRSAHIKERIDAKKQRAIAKREKKLMRPGFEGRKAGFLNQK